MVLEADIDGDGQVCNCLSIIGGLNYFQKISFFFLIFWIFFNFKLFQIFSDDFLIIFFQKAK